MGVSYGSNCLSPVHTSMRLLIADLSYELFTGVVWTSRELAGV